MVEAVTRYNFVASNDDELSFRKGDQLIVFKRAEENWYSACNIDTDKCGLVPMNYVKIKECGFLQDVTRDGAVQMLSNEVDGAFVIRRSESDRSNEKNYSLSVKYQDGVQHFKILTDPSHKFFLWVVKFSSLNELVKYYSTSSVSRTQTILLKCLSKKCYSDLAPVFRSQHPEFAKAKFDFNGEEQGEITFRMGDEIEVTKKLDENWWEGRLRNGERTGMTGLFPASYVQLIK